MQDQICQIELVVGLRLLQEPRREVRHEEAETSSKTEGVADLIVYLLEGDVLAIVR